MSRLTVFSVLLVTLPLLVTQHGPRRSSGPSDGPVSVATIPATRLLARWPQATDMRLVRMSDSGRLVWSLRLELDVLVVDAQSGALIAQRPG